VAAGAGLRAAGGQRVTHPSRRLEHAGYVRVEKVLEGRRVRTWLTATRAGQGALDAEIAALSEIINGLNTRSPRRIGPRPLTDSA